MEKGRFLVIGAGAIGTYIGGSLALAGNEVTFLEQPRAVEELRQQGLVLETGTPRGRSPAPGPTQVSLPASRVTFLSSLEEALAGCGFDAGIFALKSFDTASALAALRPHASRVPPLLCLSNGVDNEAQLAEGLGSDKVIPGTVTSSIGRRGVGNIVLERRRGVGVAAGHPLSPRLVRWLDEAGLDACLYADAAAMKWSKMLTNLPANATAAILDLTAAEVFAHPGLCRLEMEMVREALRVMDALGVRVIDLPGAPVRALRFATRLPAVLAQPLLKKALGGGRGGKMPSFHIDLHSGRGKSEVRWLNGAVARHGRQSGIPTPVNDLLMETLERLTGGEIALEAYAHQPARLLEEARQK